MPEAPRPIAVIPSDCFRWQPHVQFIDSFRTREAAFNCVLEHGYNLIVERNEGNGALFDVLDDPNGACTAGLELELLKTEEVLVDPDTEGWTRLMFLSVWHLAGRLSAIVAGVCVRVIVPRLRHAAGKSRPTIERTVHHLWRRIAPPSSVGIHRSSWYSSIPRSCRVRTFSLSTARLHTRRIAARTAAVYQRQIVPFFRSSASRCWWSERAIALRRGWHRYSQGSVSDAANRLAAEASVLYTCKIAPFFRSSASRCWWSERAIALRRGWHRYSQGTVSDAARRLGAEAAVLYAREVTPRLRYAVSRCRQADLQGACRHARSSALLTAIRLTDQCAAALAALYVRQVAPRLHRAAIRYQQADIEGTLRRSMEAVAPPRQSNPSQLH